MKPTLAAIIFAAVLALPANARAEALSLDDAFALALAHQPSLASAQLRIEQAQLDDVAIDVAAAPTLGVSAGLTASASEPVSLVSPSARLSTELVGSWNLYDFGQRRAQRAAVAASVTAARVGLSASERSILADVELSYAAVVGAGQRREVAAVSVAAEQRHLDEAQRFVTAEAGTAIDVAQAQARLASATLVLVQADTSVATARADLERALGTELPADATIGATWGAALPGEDAPLATLLAEASRTDPTLASLAAERAASTADRAATSIGTRPTLSASASAGLGSTLDENAAAWSASWSVGVRLSWQFGDGGARDLALRRADVALRSLDADVAARQVVLRHEVESARLALVGAKAAQIAATASQVAAASQLRLAEARFAAGVGNGIELADAQDAATTAAGDVTDAAYQLARARASLRHVLGRITVPSRS